MEENLYKDIFNSQNNIINSWKKNLKSIDDKGEYINYFYKIEKLNKSLREEFYKSSLELIKSMEIFLPEEKEVWKDEKTIHNALFKRPIDVFNDMTREYSFYKLISASYNKEKTSEEIALEELKVDYLKYVKKYLILISSRGYRDIYKNYINILEKSNELMEEIMTPLSEILNIKESEFELKSGRDLIENEDKILEAKEKLENIDFYDFYEKSINSQMEILNNIERFSSILIDYYNSLLDEILHSIKSAELLVLRNSNTIEIIDFEDYYSSVLKKSKIFLEENINNSRFNNILAMTIEETYKFNESNEDKEINKLKEEIEYLKNQIRDLKEKEARE